MAARASRMKHQRKRRRKARAVRRPEEDLDRDIAVFRSRIQRGFDADYTMPPEEADALPKLSEALLKVGGPLLDEALSREQYEDAVALTALAWNLSLMDPCDMADVLDMTIDGTIDNLDNETMLVSLMAALVARKLELYPNDDRHIVDYEVTGSGRWRNVLVAYATTPEHIDKLKRPKLRVVK